MLGKLVLISSQRFISLYASKILYIGNISKGTFNSSPRSESTKYERTLSKFNENGCHGNENSRVSCN